MVYSLYCRGGKAKQGKNGKKQGKKENYDLIVHLDLQEWKLSDDMVRKIEDIYMADY